MKINSYDGYLSFLRAECDKWYIAMNLAVGTSMYAVYEARYNANLKALDAFIDARLGEAD